MNAKIFALHVQRLLKRVLCILLISHLLFNRRKIACELTEQMSSPCSFLKPNYSQTPVPKHSVYAIFSYGDEHEDGGFTGLMIEARWYQCTRHHGLHS
jgi:hypothetical protein